MEGFVGFHFAQRLIISGNEIEKEKKYSVIGIITSHSIFLMQFYTHLQINVKFYTRNNVFWRCYLKFTKWEQCKLLLERRKTIKYLI